MNEYRAYERYMEEYASSEFYKKMQVEFTPSEMREMKRPPKDANVPKADYTAWNLKSGSLDWIEPLGLERFNSRVLEYKNSGVHFVYNMYIDEGITGNFIIAEYYVALYKPDKPTYVGRIVWLDGGPEEEYYIFFNEQKLRKKNIEKFSLHYSYLIARKLLTKYLLEARQWCKQWKS